MYKRLRFYYILMLSALLLVPVIGSVLVAFAGNNSIKIKQIALTTILTNTFQKISRFRWAVVLMGLVTGETVDSADVAPSSTDEANVSSSSTENSHTTSSSEETSNTSPSSDDATPSSAYEEEKARLEERARSAGDQAAQSAQERLREGHEMNLRAVYAERPPTPKELIENSVTTASYLAMVDGTSAALGTVVTASYNTEPTHIAPDGSAITVDSRPVSPSDTQFGFHGRYVDYGNSNSSILSNMIGSLRKFVFGSPLYCDADTSVSRLHDVAKSAPGEGNKQYLLSHLPTKVIVTELHAKLAQHGTIIIILAMTLKSLSLVGILLFILFTVNKYFDKVVLIFPQSVRDPIRVSWQWIRIPIAIYLTGNFIVGIYAAYKAVNFLLQNPIKYEDVKAMSDDENRVTNVNRPRATIEELENDLL